MILNTSDAGTRLELIETAVSGATQAPDTIKEGLDKGECKELCLTDTQCVIAMHKDSVCILFYYEPTVAGNTGYTMFMKKEITSTGMMKHFHKLLNILLNTNNM